MAETFNENLFLRTFLVLLVSPTQGVLRSLLGWFTVLLPDSACARVGAGHGGQAQAVGRGRCAHGADGCLSLVGWELRDQRKWVVRS